MMIMNKNRIVSWRTTAKKPHIGWAKSAQIFISLEFRWPPAASHQSFSKSRKQFPDQESPRSPTGPFRAACCSLGGRSRRRRERPTPANGHHPLQGGIHPAREIAGRALILIVLLFLLADGRRATPKHSSSSVIRQRDGR